MWLSAALSAIAFSLAATVRSETQRAVTGTDALRTLYLAEGSVERGIQWMLWGPEYRNPDGSPRFWAYDRPLARLAYASGDAVVEFIPESSKLNVNYGSADDLYRVVSTIVGDPARSREIVDAIVDWRSAAQAPTVFDGFYSSLGPTFQARHASLEEIEELLLVRGVTPEFFYGNYATSEDGRLVPRGGLRDCLSVWGSNGPFDLNTAAPALLQALGASPAMVNLIVNRRQLQPFKSMGEVSEAGLIAPSRTFINNGAGTIYTIRATARLRLVDGRASDLARSASALVKILDPRYFSPPLHILRWYDDAWSESAVAPPSGSPQP